MSRPARQLYEVDIDEKDDLWRVGAWLWGAVVILVVLFIVLQNIVLPISLLLVALVFGWLLSLRSALIWLKGGFRPSGPEPLSIRFTDIPEEKGQYEFQFYGKQKTKVGPKIKRRDVSPGEHTLWYLTRRFPAQIGDRMLSSLWSLTGPMLGGVLLRNPLAAAAHVRKRSSGGSVPYGKEPSLSERAADLGLLEEGQQIDNPHVSDF